MNWYKLAAVAVYLGLGFLAWLVGRDIIGRNAWRTMAERKLARMRAWGGLPSENTERFILWMSFFNCWIFRIVAGIGYPLGLAYLLLH